jgi:flagellar biosynthesis protein FlhG
VKDQAAHLRREVQSGARVIVVTSGKGGVGKTNVSANLAIALGTVGWRTLLVDADLSLANVDVVCGVVPAWNLGHVQRGEKTLPEIVQPIGESVDLVAGGSGLPEFFDAGSEAAERLLAGVEALVERYDAILIDTAAGLDSTILAFLGAADEVVLVTTPEPTAITDAYAVVKALAQQGALPPVALVMNRVVAPEEGRRAVERFRVVAERFLGVDVALLGLVPEDPRVPRAVKAQRPFVLEFPRSAAAIALFGIAARLAQRPLPAHGLEGFLQRLRARLGGMSA